MSDQQKSNVEVVEIPASVAEFALACGLAHDATKPQILAKISTSKVELDEAHASVAEIFKALSVDSLEKALGAIAAGKGAVGELATVKASNEKMERAQVIAQAKTEKKLTPHQEKQLEGQSLDFVKSFVALQVPNATIAKKDEDEASSGTSDLTHNGKKWAEMTPMEKHALHNTNHDLYVAMRDAANKDD